MIGEARHELGNMDVGRNRVLLRTRCTDQKGEMVAEGQSVLVPPKNMQSKQTT